MKPIEHLKSYCTFWRPSLARRITLYFLAFGLIIFLITSGLHMVGAKKQFMHSTSKIIRNQFFRLSGAEQPDFLWNGIGQRQPALYRLESLLRQMTSDFYSVADLSIYSQQAQESDWYRLFMKENGVLQAERIEDRATRKLERGRRHRFRSSSLNFFGSETALSMMVDLTKPSDQHRYFLKLDIGRESMAGWFKRQAQFLMLFLVLVLIISRFVGYFFARKISRPIEDLSAFTTGVAGGDLSQTVPITRRDEIGRLAENFNTMIEGLREWERMKVIEFELEKGQQIQKDFLPGQLPNVPDWDIAICFQPAGQVAGDFYDVFKLPNGDVGLVIADVCDKGVGSALYMALFRSLIRVFSLQGVEEQHEDAVARPSDREIVRTAVSMTNDYIARNHGDECMFATLFFGVLDPVSGELAYINAGHEPLYVIGPTGIRSALSPTGPAVGLVPEARFQIQQIQLNQGDLLLGYTDGVTEARSAEDKIFTRERLRALAERPGQTANDLLETIKRDLFAFIDREPRIDDVTMLAVQRAPAV
jgi:serine phosphatase RsbU (regulator of sigma subunit)